MTSHRKKILILIDWFYPGYKAGGPIQSVLNLIRILKNDFDVHILTTDTDHGEEKPYADVTSDEWIFSEELGINIFYARKASLNKRRIRSQIDFVDADYIYLNHLYSPLFVIYPLLLKSFGKIKAKVVVCPRGALFESAISVKAFKKRPLLFLYNILKIQKYVLFHATNDRESEAIKKYFPGSDIVIADNLPLINQAQFVSILKRRGELKCVFISRIVPIKNLSYLLDLFRQLSCSVRFTIAGPAEDIQYWNSCKQQINELPPNISVEYYGPVEKSNVLSVIQKNHLFILPTKGENFGHAIFEAFLSGRPVLISNQTPWRNLRQFNAGWDLPLEKPEEFIHVIQQMAETDQSEFDTYAKSAWCFADEFIKKSLSQNNYLKLFS